MELEQLLRDDSEEAYLKLVLYLYNLEAKDEAVQKLWSAIKIEVSEEQEDKVIEKVKQVKVDELFLESIIRLKIGKELVPKMFCQRFGGKSSKSNDEKKGFDLDSITASLSMSILSNPAYSLKLKVLSLCVLFKPKSYSEVKQEVYEIIEKIIRDQATFQCEDQHLAQEEILFCTILKLITGHMLQDWNFKKEIKVRITEAIRYYMETKGYPTTSSESEDENDLSYIIRPIEQGEIVPLSKIIAMATWFLLQNSDVAPTFISTLLRYVLYPRINTIVYVKFVNSTLFPISTKSKSISEYPLQTAFTVEYLRYLFGDIKKIPETQVKLQAVRSNSLQLLRRFIITTLKSINESSHYSDDFIANLLQLCFDLFITKPPHRKQLSSPQINIFTRSQYEIIQIFKEKHFWEEETKRCTKLQSILDTLHLPTSYSDFNKCFEPPSSQLNLFPDVRELCSEYCWEKTHHAYGFASGTPHDLEGFLSFIRSERRYGYEQLEMSILHQGSQYTSTILVIEVFRRILSSAQRSLPDISSLLRFQTRCIFPWVKVGQGETPLLPTSKTYPVSSLCQLVGYAACPTYLAILLDTSDDQNTIIKMFEDGDKSDDDSYRNNAVEHTAYALSLFPLFSQHSFPAILQFCSAFFPFPAANISLSPSSSLSSPTLKVNARMMPSILIAMIHLAPWICSKAIQHHPSFHSECTISNLLPEYILTPKIINNNNDDDCHNDDNDNDNNVKDKEKVGCHCDEEEEDDYLTNAYNKVISTYRLLEKESDYFTDDQFDHSTFEALSQYLLTIIEFCTQKESQMQQESGVLKLSIYSRVSSLNFEDDGDDDEEVEVDEKEKEEEEQFELEKENEVNELLLDSPSYFAILKLLTSISIARLYACWNRANECPELPIHIMLKQITYSMMTAWKCMEISTFISSPTELVNNTLRYLDIQRTKTIMKNILNDASVKKTPTLLEFYFRCFFPDFRHSSSGGWSSHIDTTPIKLAKDLVRFSEEQIGVIKHSLQAFENLMVVYPSNEKYKYFENRGWGEVFEIYKSLLKTSENYFTPQLLEEAISLSSIPKIRASSLISTALDLNPKDIVLPVENIEYSFASCPLRNVWDVLAKNKVAFLVSKKKDLQSIDLPFFIYILIANLREITQTEEISISLLLKFYSHHQNTTLQKRKLEELQFGTFTWEALLDTPFEKICSTFPHYIKDDDDDDEEGTQKHPFGEWDLTYNSCSYSPIVTGRLSWVIHNISKNTSYLYYVRSVRLSWRGDDNNDYNNNNNGNAALDAEIKRNFMGKITATEIARWVWKHLTPQTDFASFLSISVSSAFSSIRRISFTNNDADNNNNDDDGGDDDDKKKDTPYSAFMFSTTSKVSELIDILIPAKNRYVKLFGIVNEEDGSLVASVSREYLLLSVPPTLEEFLSCCHLTVWEYVNRFCPDALRFETLIVEHGADLSSDHRFKLQSICGQLGVLSDDPIVELEVPGKLKFPTSIMCVWLVDTHRKPQFVLTTSDLLNFFHHHDENTLM